MKLFLFTALAVAAGSQAHPNPSSKTCTSYKIPVTVTSTNVIWSYPAFKDNYDVTDFVTNALSRTADKDFIPFAIDPKTHAPEFKNVTASYTIGATFCAPTGRDSKTLLVATHGLDFDRSYWNLPIEAQKYNFVDHAVAKGYSVLFYDRLGVGESSVVSGYINQVSIQIEILKAIVAQVKKGRYTGSLGVPKKLVLVGHSLGSAISAAAAADIPDIADGLILTGFSFNSTAQNGNGFLETVQFRIASGLDSKWRKLDTGYLSPVDIYSNINTFLKKPDYEITVAEYAFNHRSPIGILEPLSLGLPNINLAPVTFKGSVLNIAGQYDFIFCKGQCDDVLASPATQIFANAKNFKVVSYAGSGHALNLAANVTGAYDIITEFLASSGL